MNSLLSSELVLNNDGSIYHLHLQPEDIAGTIILVGDPDRVSLVSDHFDTVEVRKQKREFVTHTGRISTKRLTVISTGIGTDNIDIVMNELDALVNIDLPTRSLRAQQTSLKFIRIGTSGSLQADTGVDSILVSSHGLGLDALMSFYHLHRSAEEAQTESELFAQLGEIAPWLYFVQSPGSLRERFGKYPAGITATCCGFYAPQGRMLRARAEHPALIASLSKVRTTAGAITNFEMETAGIYGLAKMLGHEAVSVNAILANRITGEFSRNPASVVNRAIREVLEVATNLG
jgi:uridine phosphorylase